MRKPSFGSRARLLPLAVFCLLLVVPFKLAQAQNYSCGNPSSGHCYGFTIWQEQPQYFGSFTSILQIGMNCPSNCGGFLNNEMWLGDSETPACASNAFGACWVEAGFHAFSGQGNPFYFWADSRPLASNTYNNHFLNQADAADYTHFMIVQDARGRPGVYQVWIYNDTQSVLFNGTSTSNTMTAHNIDIGMELAGTSGGSAAPSQFQQNYWAVSPLTSEYVFWYNTEIDNGSVTSQAPPNASWLIPAAISGSNGGIFTTNCCQ